MTEKFRVGISADFKHEGAGVLEPILAEQFNPRADIAYEFLNESRLLLPRTRFENSMRSLHCTRASIHRRSTVWNGWR